MTTMDIREDPGSYLVMCKSYKTTAEDREEILRIVGDWKHCGIFTETVSAHASRFC